MRINIVGGISVTFCLDAKDGSQMDFADTQRAQGIQHFPRSRQTHDGKFFNLMLVNGGLKSEIQGIQRFFKGSPDI